ncbi:MAG TPA: hypothetical protein VN108_06885 [Marmoricola sp.]|nr:hypothetical protein [Marmoricola sp.]
MGKHRDETSSSRPGFPGTDRPPVGTLAEEATQLFAVIAGMAKEQTAQYASGADSVTSSAAAAVKSINEHIATGDAECTYCPVCRVVHAARSASPEVKAHLSTALLSLAQAAASLMAPPTPEPTKPAESDEDVAAPADGHLHKINFDDQPWE